MLSRIAALTEGFAGADLQALCTAAVMAAVSRTAPDLVDQLCDQADDPCGVQQQDQEQQQPNKQGQQHGQEADEQQRKQEQQPARDSQGRHEQQHDQQHRQHVDDLLQSGQQAPLRQQQQQQGQLRRKLPGKLLEKLRVKALDWRAALAAAPLPCSARQNLSALSSGHAKALPDFLAPLLLPSIIRALQCIAAAQLPWQGTAAAALEAATAAADKVQRANEADGEAAAAMPEAGDPEGRSRRLESLLAELGAVQAPSCAQAGQQQSLGLHTRDDRVKSHDSTV